MKGRLASLAIRAVPPDWRDDVARELAEERKRGALVSVSFCALTIGLRLRLARAVDRDRPLLTLSTPRRLPMHHIARDLTMAIRGALRRPGYSIAVIATLAIGIGANTAIFSVFNWILFRPLPAVQRPAELVTIKFETPRFEGSYFISYRDYAELRDVLTATVSGLAAANPLKMEMTSGDTTRPVNVEVVTWNYLSLLEAHPRLGRDFTAAEEALGGPASAIIGDALWRRSYGGSAGAIGRTITLNGRTFTIVGVAPEGFQGRSMVTAAEVWLPISAYATLMPPASRARFHERRSTFFGDAFARLRPGTSLEQAQTEADAAMASVPEFADRSRSTGARSEIHPVLYAGIGHETYVLERLSTVFRLLMGAVGLLLLLACANAANLLLARSAARRREIAVCQAIGASRARIARQQLVEGSVLSVAAGALGLAIAAWLTSLFDGMRILSFLPVVSGVSVDWRVALFALSASILTGLLFATAPALVSSRIDLLPSLKDGGGATRGGRRLLRSALVTVQITVSVLLLFGAGLFLRTLDNVRGIDIGIQPEGVVGFSINPSRFGMDDTRSITYIQDLLERLRHAPGISSAAFVWATSFSSSREDTTFARVDDPEISMSARETTISPRFFHTMGIPLIAGRDFSEADTRRGDDKSGPVIISRTLAEKLFPDGGALGSRLTLSYPEGKIVEVVGIVGDVRGRSVTSEPDPWAYAPAVKPAWGTIQVKSGLPAAQVVATVRETARAIDPVVAPHDIETFGATVDRALSEQRLFARVSGVFAVIAALLAALGIYSMMAGAVAERRKEFGIRLALGATAAAVMTLVMRSATLIAGIGLALGLAGAAALGQVVESRLYGVSTLDPVSIAAAAIAILTLTIVASLVPALRASRVDPVQSLRTE